MEHITLSAAELEVLQVLWAAGRALSRPEILEGMTHKPKSTNAIHPILNSLIAKEMIHVEGMVLCSKIYGRTYAASLSQKDFLIRCTEEVLPDATPQARLLKVVSALADEKDIDVETLTKLEELLEDRRRELRRK